MITLDKENTKLLKARFGTNFALSNFLVLVFLILGLIGIFHHEMWRDELQAWLIAKESSSLIDLFHNLRYESHPALWHSCLYVITRFTLNPIAMQVFHILIATGVIYVFTRFSPFTQLQKILFTFSYFPFYEYSIISRNYNLGALLIFIFCALYPRRDQNYLTLATVLFLMANTNAYACIIAIALTMTLLLDAWFNPNIIGLVKTKKWEIIISLTIIILGVTIAIFQLLPPPSSDFTLKETAITSTKATTEIIAPTKIVSTFATIWKSYIPIPNFFSYEFWGSNILIDKLVNGGNILKLVALFLSVTLFLLSSSLFVCKPVVLFLYLSGTGGILLLTYTKFLGGLRHHGNLFILFIACLWIASLYQNSGWAIKPFQTWFNFINKYKTRWLSFILCIHVFAGIFAFTMDLNYKFSGSKEIADLIVNKNLSQNLIVASPDYIGTPISAFLNQKIYYLESEQFGSFIVWKNRSEIKSKQKLAKVSQVLPTETSKALLIVNEPLRGKRHNLRISQVEKFTKSIVRDENYYLYIVEKQLGDIQPKN